MRSLTSSSPVWSSSRISPRAGDVVGVLGPLVPRDVEDGVQPGTDPAGLGRRVGSAFELVDFLQRGVPDRLRQVRRLHPGPVVVFLGGRVAVQVGEFLPDRGELLAQQEFPLLLLHALRDVLADGFGDVELGQVLAGPADDQLQPLDQVGGLEQLQLLLGGEVAGVPGVVGDRRRVVQLLDHVDDLPRAALLQDPGDQGLVLLGQLVGPRAAAGLLDHRALDPERGTRTRGARADLHPGDTADERTRLPAGKPAHLLDRSQGPHAGQTAVRQARHEQHPRPRLGTHARNLPRRHPRRVDRGADLCLRRLQRHHHPRQYHLVVERQDRKRERFTHREPPKIESYTLKKEEPSQISGPRSPAAISSRLPPPGLREQCRSVPRPYRVTAAEDRQRRHVPGLGVEVEQRDAPRVLRVGPRHQPGIAQRGWPPPLR